MAFEFKIRCNLVKSDANNTFFFFLSFVLSFYTGNLTGLCSRCAKKVNHRHGNFTKETLSEC